MRNALAVSCIPSQKCAQSVLYHVSRDTVMCNAHLRNACTVSYIIYVQYCLMRALYQVSRYSAVRLAVAAPPPYYEAAQTRTRHAVQCRPTGHFVALKLKWGLVRTITIVISIDIIPYQTCCYCCHFCKDNFRLFWLVLSLRKITHSPKNIDF